MLQKKLLIKIYEILFEIWEKLKISLNISNFEGHNKLLFN